MAFDNLKAPTAINNATLEQARQLIPRLQADRISGEVLIFANQTGMGNNRNVPEKRNAEGDYLGAPFVDDGQTLTEMGVPDDEPLYLEFWLAQIKRMQNVGLILHKLNEGLTLQQAVG